MRPGESGFGAHNRLDYYMNYYMAKSHAATGIGLAQQPAV